MGFFKGVSYNLRGVTVGIKNSRLLLLGMLRFAVMIALTLLCAGLVFAYYQDILQSIWSKPESNWVVWLWYLLSWILWIVLFSVTSVMSYLMSQILFSVVIMDLMSRITEDLFCETPFQPPETSWLKQFGFLVRQELPRTILPVMLTLVITVIGWVTPLAPIVTVVSSAAAAVFLAWDNTDLVPARRLIPFGERLRFLGRHVFFHLGFGVLLLIPVLNIALLAFAPVGATLFHCDLQKKTA